MLTDFSTGSSSVPKFHLVQNQTVFLLKPTFSPNGNQRLTCHFYHARTHFWLFILLLYLLSVSENSLNPVPFFPFFPILCPTCSSQLSEFTISFKLISLLDSVLIHLPGCLLRVQTCHFSAQSHSKNPHCLPGKHSVNMNLGFSTSGPRFPATSPVIPSSHYVPQERDNSSSWKHRACSHPHVSVLAIFSVLKATLFLPPQFRYPFVSITCKLFILLLYLTRSNFQHI